MARVLKKDDRPFWIRRSFIGEHISNRNWIIAMILLISAGFAFHSGWVVTAVGLGVAGMLSFVWNEGVAKTTTIIGVWIVAGGSSAWLLGLICGAVTGMPIIGYAMGLAVGIVGVMMTID